MFISQGTRTATVQTFVILRGTVAYTGAQGTMAMKPLGPDGYRLTFRFVD